MPLDHIYVKGAREHNLKNINVRIPRDKMVVITGLSGSGKSSLAFDTIYAEGQRRYVESLSAYARQFLGQMEKPDVDFIEGLSPAVSIDQKGSTRNPRSTVGTVTEIYDHMRLLFARVGVPHCPNHGVPIVAQTVQEIVDQIQALPEGSRILVLGPLVRDRKGEHQQLFATARRGGFARVRVDGIVRDLSEDITLDKMKKHSVEVVVDRLVVRREAEAEAERSRLTDSVETALPLGAGLALVADADGKGPERLFSERLACPEGDFSIGEIEPRTFSFNSPHGACPACTGLGTKLEPDPDLVLGNPDLTLKDGAVLPWQKSSGTAQYRMAILEGLARKFKFSLDAPIKSLTKKAVDAILNGTEDALKLTYENRNGQRRSYEYEWEGVLPWLDRQYRETTSDFIRADIERYMSERPCPVCKGKRLKPEALAVTIGDRSIADVTALTVSECLEWTTSLEKERGGLGIRARKIAKQVLKEIRTRLGFLMDVGLDYLTVDRSATTLSGGEAQRIRLATQIGSGLMGVLYILDEPSIGLHQRDNARLIRPLLGMRDLGNTIIVCTHAAGSIPTAEWVIGMGPGAGEHGGEVVAEGPLEAILREPRSLTGAYLSGRRRIPMPAHRRSAKGDAIVVRGAREHNLKNIDVRIPLGVFVSITGVSGSGKSTLVNEVLYRRLAQVINKAKERPGAHDKIEGIQHIDKVIDIDQSPIGRTPRSNPATYTGLFTPIRDLFAALPEARLRGYIAGRSSPNVTARRREAGAGDARVLEVPHRLVEAGNTVVVIEHNLDVVKTADWIIELGPEGGRAGGEVIAEGTPEAVAGSRRWFTGRYLRELLATGEVRGIA